MIQNSTTPTPSVVAVLVAATNTCPRLKVSGVDFSETRLKLQQDNIFTNPGDDSILFSRYTPTTS